MGHLTPFMNHYPRNGQTGDGVWWPRGTIVKIKKNKLKK